LLIAKNCEFARTDYVFRNRNNSRFTFWYRM